MHKNQERYMEHTPDKSQSMTVERDDSGATQLPDSIVFQNLSEGAKVLLGQNMIVVQ